ncbi:MAG: sigma 54-interacting transcriptional regulator [Myxococcota bacterium]
MIAWSMRDPSRLGESCVFPEEQQARIIGRGRGEPSDGAARAEFIPRRPGFSGAAAPLDGATLSRRHVRVTRVGDALNVTNMGRSTMALDGEPVARCELVESCTLLLAQEMLFLCDRRPTDFGRVQKGQGDFDFGRADPQGLVGETAEFWALRDRIRFAAGTSAGVLVTGSAGSGRESVGRAIHKLSPSRQNPIVAIDGSSLRSDDLEGLLRREDHPTLLIDELSDVGFELQPTLARYAARIATRPPPRGQLLATTTKNADKIRPSLANRFPLTVRVPDLEERRADIPLIARDMLHHMAREQPEIGHRYFEGWDETEPGKGEPRLSPLLMIRLLVHEWAGNVRELSSVLWRIVLSSPSTFLDVTPDVEPLLGLPRGTEPGVLEPQAIRDALRHTNGKVAAAARHLGLKSRFQLYRLMEKYDIKG